MNTETTNNAFWRQGKVWMSAVAVVTGIAGWMVYDAMMAPGWMRDFGLEVAAKAKIVATNQDQTAFSTMQGRVEPTSQYICLARVADFSWDRVHVIPSGGTLSGPVLDLEWSGGNIDEILARMADDDRYQLFVFEQAGRVVEYEYYFTMWADLSALARPTGYTKTEAIFVAESNGETYTIMPADVNSGSVCL